MSVVAAALRELIAHGVSGDALIQAVERIERAVVEERAQSVREAVDIASKREDEALAARKAKAAERTRKWRENRDPSVTVTSPSVTEHHSDAGDVLAPPSLPSSPQTPQQPTHPPGDINTRAKPAFGKSNGFARFWEAYPNKVGKAAAEKSYGRALGKIGGPDPPAVLLAGVERAKASREWREGFIPHPTTWLNQGRWDDEPAETPQPQARKAPHERPHHDAKFDARQANLARAYAGSERAIGRDWEP